MIKQKHLALMLVRFFDPKLILTLLIVNIFLINISLTIADEKEKKPKKNELNKNFGAAVIDMQKVLSKSTAWTHFKNR